MANKEKAATLEHVEAATPPMSLAAEASKTFDVAGLRTERQQAWFAQVAKIIYKDLNNSTRSTVFSKYTKDQIASYLQNPEANEEQLRNAVVMLYNLSSHFVRLIRYFSELVDCAYIISQTAFDESDDEQETLEKYQKTAVFLAGSDLKTQCQKILTVCFREDACYCTTWITKTGMSFQILNPQYCKIVSQSQNCLNIAFNFSYFDQYNDELEFYPAEFQTKYQQYQKDTTQRWIELDAPYSFAIKYHQDLLYCLPPLGGILREIYSLEDYRDLKLTAQELQNYKLLVMELGLNSQGEWNLDFEKAKDFFYNLEAVLPPQIGATLSPMKITPIDFERSGTAESDKVAECQDSIWASAGVSSLIFSGSSTSSRALEISGMADESMTWSLVQQIGVAINRILQKQAFAKSFRIVFLPCGRYTREAYQKSLSSGIQYGLPVTPLLATMGLEPLYALGLNHIEAKVLDLSNRFVPLQSGNTISKSEGGRPQAEGGDLTDEGVRSREKK